MAQSNLGKAYVQIVPSAKGISGSISKVLDSEAASAGQSTGAKIAGFMKKAVIAAGIGKLLKDSLMEGARYEQARGGIETLFGAKGAKSVQEYAKMVGKSVTEVSGEYNRLKSVEDQMMKNANNAWKTAGISANEYMEQSTSFAASLLQSVGGNQKKAADAANQAVIDMSDNANKMGTNIQDIQNAYQGFAKQNYTMLDNLKLGYGGTKTEMERLLADAEKITGVKYDINNLSDVYSAIHVIQGELGITGTTALEAEKTLSGSFSSMSAAAHNFMAQLVVGEDVSGAMDALLESTMVFGENLLNALGKVLLNLPDAIGHLSETLIAKVQESMDNPDVGNAAGKFLEKFIIGLAKNLPKLLAAALSVAAYLVSALGQAAGSLIQSGAQAIAAWAQGLWQGFTTRATEMLESIKASVVAKFDSFKAAIVSKISETVASVASAFSAVKDAIARPFETARSLVKSAIDKIKRLFPLRIGKIFSNLRLPHISVSGGKAPFGIGGKGSLPKFNVQWNKFGGVYDSESIVGIGVGEAGREIITPEELMRQIVNESNSEVVEILRRILEILIVIASSDRSFNLDGKEFARAAAPYFESEINTRQTRANRKLGYV